MTAPESLPQNRQKSRRRVLRVALIVATAALASCFIFLPQLRPWIPHSVRLPIVNKTWRYRPYGMAPTAFQAFVKACDQAGVSSNRTTQTIGDNPRSFGYHLKDGELKSQGEHIEYSAATDIHVIGLSEPQIKRLVKALKNQGFACWYRHEGKWKGVEHIHAVYAFLPMKEQLRRQVRLYLREGNPHWEEKWRRSRFAK